RICMSAFTYSAGRPPSRQNQNKFSTSTLFRLVALAAVMAKRFMTLTINEELSVWFRIYSLMTETSLRLLMRSIGTPLDCSIESFWLAVIRTPGTPCLMRARAIESALEVGPYPKSFAKKITLSYIVTLLKIQKFFIHV